MAKALSSPRTIVYCSCSSLHHRVSSPDSKFGHGSFRRTVPFRKKSSFPAIANCLSRCCFIDVPYVQIVTHLWRICLAASNFAGAGSATAAACLFYFSVPGSFLAMNVALGTVLELHHVSQLEGEVEKCSSCGSVLHKSCHIKLGTCPCNSHLVVDEKMDNKIASLHEGGETRADLGERFRSSFQVYL